MRRSGTAALTATWVARSSVRPIIGVKTGPGCTLFHPDPVLGVLDGGDLLIPRTANFGCGVGRLGVPNACV